MSTTDPPRSTSPRTDLRTRIIAGLWILGTLQFFTLHLIVQSAWPQPYSWWLNYISDLGAVHCGPILAHVVCSPLHSAMNVAFVLQGICLFAGARLTPQAWKETSGELWPVMIMITGASDVVVGLVPEDVNLILHSIGALPIFILGNIALVTAGRSHSTRGAPFVRRSALVLGVSGLIGFALTVVAMAWPTGPIGVGGAERLTVFPLQLWALIIGTHLLTGSASNSTRVHEPNASRSSNMS